MFDQEANTREAIRRRRARIEQIERILSAPNCERGSPQALRLIEEKQHHELATAELERSLTPLVGTESGHAASNDSHRKRAFCLEVVNEIRKVKNRYNSGYSVAQIRKEHPDWSVWKVLEGLTDEDRELFHHPRQWGPVAGYGEHVLGKYYGRSAATIHDWCKAARRLQRKRIPRK